MYDLCIVVSAQNADKLMVAAGSVFRSTDGGANFYGPGSSLDLTTPHNIYVTHTDIQSMHAIQNSDGSTDTYITTDDGVTYSSDFFSDINNVDIRNKGISSAEFDGFEQGWDQDIIVIHRRIKNQINKNQFLVILPSIVATYYKTILNE